MSTPAEPGPETAPDGHTWLPQEYCADQGLWAPPDPTDIPPEWPAWRLPDWYAGLTGMVQVPSPSPTRPGTYQYVWGGWLPWQARTDSFDPLAQWPDAVRATVGDMQAELWPPAPAEDAPPAEADVPLIALSGPDEPDAVPPLTDPTPGLDPAAPEGN